MATMMDTSGEMVNISIKRDNIQMNQKIDISSLPAIREIIKKSLECLRSRSIPKDQVGKLEK